MERLVLLTALFTPVITGLLAKTAERETARRWLVTWLPLSFAAPLALRALFSLPEASLLAHAASMFCMGITTGLTFWAARSLLRNRAAT